MYNRYIPEGGHYVRISADEPTSASRREASRRPPSGSAAPTGQRTVFGGKLPDLAALLGLKNGTEGKENAGGLAGILNLLKLDHLDTGDILLLLILLFLFLEGDNLELVITLALMLLLGLGDDEEEGISCE